MARALADFDAATIATTHEFCLQMLDGLGVLGDREQQAVFVEQVSDLTREAATDLYLRRYATWDQPPMSYPEAVDIAQQAVSAGHARLVPAGSGDDDPSGAAERVELCRRGAGARSRPGPAPVGCSPTTTCSPGYGTRWPIRSGAPRPPNGCGSAIGW